MVGLWAYNLHVVRVCEPWNVRSGLILLAYGPRNANGTNLEAPERSPGTAFRYVPAYFNHCVKVMVSMA